MEITVLTPTGTLGYGFDEAALERGLSMNPDVIAVDAGSTDPGPHYLGSGEPLVSKFSIKRELTELIVAAKKRKIPLVVGSAGGAGSVAHVDATVQIVREIVKENALSLRLAYIYSDVSADRVKRALRADEVQMFEASFELTEDLVDASEAIVAQMGYEPIIEALQQEADVVIAGRACDDCAIAAYPIMRGADPANSIHMGKILECGAFSAEPFAMDVMMGTVGENGFLLYPGSDQRRASVASVAAHSLYERENPFFQAGPGHALELGDCVFEQIDQNTVKVSGAVFRKDSDCWVKLEGAMKKGYRTICVAGVRCPTMIERIDSILDSVKQDTLRYFSEPSLSLIIHCYGRSGVMGEREPDTSSYSKELGLVFEAVANDQTLANAACHHASGATLHYHYEGQCNTSGNLAFLYSPSDINTGAAYEFSAYHLMKVTSPTEIFPIHVEVLGV